MFRKVGLFSSEENGFSWWWFGIKVGVVASLIVWWWLDNKNRKVVQEAASGEPTGDLPAIPLPPEEALQDESARKSKTMESEQTAAVPIEPDDLTRIEGIGPKISAALQAAGILTYQQLASKEPAALKTLLAEAGIRIGQPDTWPEQAALAAKADWEALGVLQDGLQGGRRIV